MSLDNAGLNLKLAALSWDARGVAEFGWAGFGLARLSWS